MDTRLPHCPGRDDFASYVRFLDNRKEFDRYVGLLDKKIIEFMDAVKLYGKAKDIERLHSSAEAIQQQAQDAFEGRESVLKKAELEFKQTVADETKALSDTETAMQERHNVKGRELRDRELAVQERERVIDEREAAAAQMLAHAERAKETAKKAKRAADDVVKNMQAAMPAG